MELRGPYRAVLDSGDEPIAAVFSPGDLAAAVLGEVAHSVTVDEVEALVLDTGEQLRAGGCLDGVPPHVGQAIRMQLFDSPGPDAAPFRPHPVLDADREEHLMPDTDSRRRPADRRPLRDDLRAADCDEAVHACRECANPGYDQAGGGPGLVWIGGNGHLNPGPGHRTLGRPQVARAIIQDHDRSHNAPFVLGTPSTRGSGSTASRSARANALNWHSTMWCGSRPAISVMCRQSWA